MSGLRRILPSANLLLLFEAAARHLNFTRAAEELGISQPAVSHGVRTLEQHLGVALFRREHRGVVLTQQGSYFMQEVTIGFEHIYRAARDLQLSQRSSQVVTLSVSTATATYWLLPRVAAFKQRYPEIELRCLTTDYDPDLRREGIDLGITLGSGDWPQYDTWHFVDETVYAVCSPEFYARHGPFVEPADLLPVSLLHLEQRYLLARSQWPDWFRYFDCPPPAAGSSLSFSDYSIVIQAALAGQGVALGWQHIVKPLLQEGRLVQAVPHCMTTNQPFYIVAVKGISLSAAAESLRDWLIREVRGESYEH